MDQAAFSCVMMDVRSRRQDAAASAWREKDHRFDEICVTVTRDSPEPFGPPDSVTHMCRGSV